MRTQAKQIALGGMMAALALVIMNLGGLIPVATFVCPMLAILLLSFVTKLCGNRIGWAWYGAVAILGLLLAPDKEGAAVFLFLGYYPIIKPQIDGSRLRILLKALLFNASILLMYGLLIHLFGMDQIAQEYEELGTVLTAVMLVLGNVIFFMLDFVLSRLAKIKYNRAG